VAAIFMLSMRQLAGSRRVWLVLVIVAIPVLAALLYRAAESSTPSGEFADEITERVLATAILPLVVVLLATAAFGNEISDKTLGYLALKPLPRWQIVLPKLLAAVVVGGVPVAVSGLVTVWLIVEGDAAGAVATALGLLAGAVAYAAVFTWAGLATRNAVIFGLVYVFVWEASLATYLDGIRFLSVGQYTLALISGLDDARLATLDLTLGAGTAAACAAIVTVGFTLLAVRRLARMDVP
jgi:ABC-2 type transport system permease protein